MNVDVWVEDSDEDEEEEVRNSRSEAQCLHTGGKVSVIPCGSSVQGGGFKGVCDLSRCLNMVAPVVLSGGRDYLRRFIWH